MFHLILVLALFGFALYLIERFIPMADPFRVGIRVVAGVCVVFYLLQAFGVLNHDIPVPQIR